MPFGGKATLLALAKTLRESRFVLPALDQRSWPVHCVSFAPNGSFRGRRSVSLETKTHANSLSPDVYGQSTTSLSPLTDHSDGGGASPLFKRPTPAGGPALRQSHTALLHFYSRGSFRKQQSVHLKTGTLHHVLLPRTASQPACSSSLTYHSRDKLPPSPF